MKRMMDEDSFLKARQNMVDSQINQRGIHDGRVLKAFRKIPRHLFVPEKYISQAYSDHPLPIGNGQTISQPYIVALMTAHLDLNGEEKVLEIGTGSGYQTAVLAFLTKEVHSIEVIPELSDFANKNLQHLNFKNVHLHVGDGSLGNTAHAPFDRIIITAAAPDIPELIVEQLNSPGRLVAPVGGRWRQTLEVWKKDGKGIEIEKILPVVFVPLRGEHGWQE